MRAEVDRIGAAEVLTAAAAESLAAHFAGWLAAAGVPTRTHVVFAVPNSARAIAAIWGTLRSHRAAVVISDQLTPRERSELIADVDPALVVDADELAAAFAAAAGRELAVLTPTLAARPMHFTSGTSGRPKGVWSGWLTPAAAQAFLTEEAETWQISAADRHLVCGPISHSAPLRFPLATLAAGGTVVVPPSYDAATTAALIETGQVTTTFMAPAHLKRLLGDPPKTAAMRLVAHAGSVCPDGVRQGARAIFGDAALREFYAATEGQFTTCTPADFDAHPGTVGRARTGRELRADGEGRLWCRVPEHARFSYWGDPAKTAQAWDGDWFTVGDLGRVDESGYVFLEGRRSDLIISGGVNVYPAEIERVVLDLPGVQLAGAFGLDDDTWGQRVCLAVVGEVGRAEVVAHCARELAPAKRPKEVHVVGALPLTHSGKVDRVRLPQQFG